MTQGSVLLPKLLRFCRRHRFSLPLASLSLLCFVKLAFEVRAGEMDGVDSAVSAWVASWRGGADKLMLTFTHFGGPSWMVILALAVVAALLMLRRAKEARFLIVSATGALILNSLLKLAFSRARPEAESLYLLPPPVSFSFPSGHAMCSLGVLGSLMVLARVLELRPWLRVLVMSSAALSVFLVGTSRVYFGVHYPSDVLGGQLAGAAWVSAVTGWFYPRLLPGEASGAGR